LSDCVVIGGGLIGMLTARELCAAGATATVLERGETGKEASWAGGGILSPLYPWRQPLAVTILARWSQQQYAGLAKNLAEESGIDPEWTRSGVVILDVDDRERALAWAEGTGVAVEVVEPRELAVLVPALGASCVSRAGIWMPQVAQIRNPRLLKALKLSLLKRGVSMHEHCEVTGLRICTGHVTGVETKAGTVGAGCVIVAAGAWSGNLLKNLAPHVKICPVGGQMILFRTRPGLLTRIVLSQDHYLIPRRDGRILVGSTLERTGFCKSTTVRGRDELCAAALKMVPDLARFQVEHHWAGLRPEAPVGIPFIGGHPGIKDLYVNTGHFRNGILLAPASARLLVDLITKRDPIVDPAPYALTAERELL
jgi:glycine oxidase ThiO